MMLIRRLFLLLIRVYQLLVSPLLGPCCRFHPSCSCYAAECVSRFGVLRGGWLALKRLLRCHPLGGQGYDPPPALLTEKTKGT
jgi:putative membrane protein insertion efficiency factor